MRHVGFIVLTATLTLSIAAPASAASLILAWDMNSDTITKGYVVYYGTTSRTYTGQVDAGNVNYREVAGLLDNTKYFFAVRAYDKDGRLSDLSEEVSGTTGGVLPPAQLRVAITPKNGTFTSGAQATFSIVVSNTLPPGGNPATNVMLTDVLPGYGGLIWQTATTTQGNCGVTSNNLSCALGTINAGGFVTIVVTSTATTPASACQAQPNPAALATADGGLTAQDSGLLTCGAPPPPGQRMQLTANVRADRFIDLAWTPPTNDPTMSFRVEVGTLPTFTAFSAVTTGRSISFDMSDLIVPAYFVRVRPIVNGIFGPASNEVSLTPTLIVPGNEESPPGTCVAPPGTPRRFISNAIGSAVSLTWQRGVGDAPSGYVLEVGTAPGLSNLMTVPLGPAASLNANASNGIYALRLLATNQCGASTWGAEATLTVSTTTLNPPGAPAGLSRQVTGRTVSLSWQPPTTGGAPTYYILEATVGSVTYTFNTGSAATTATYANVPPGQYVVRVRAGNSAGSGPATSTVTVTVF